MHLEEELSCADSLSLRARIKRKTTYDSVLEHDIIEAMSRRALEILKRTVPHGYCPNLERGSSEYFRRNQFLFVGSPPEEKRRESFDVSLTC